MFAQMNQSLNLSNLPVEILATIASYESKLILEIGNFSDESTRAKYIIDFFEKENHTYISNNISLIKKRNKWKFHISSKEIYPDEKMCCYFKKLSHCYFISYNVSSTSKFIGVNDTGDDLEHLEISSDKPVKLELTSFKNAFFFPKLKTVSLKNIICFNRMRILNYPVLETLTIDNKYDFFKLDYSENLLCVSQLKNVTINHSPLSEEESKGNESILKLYLYLYNSEISNRGKIIKEKNSKLNIVIEKRKLVDGKIISYYE